MSRHAGLSDESVACSNRVAQQPDGRRRCCARKSCSPLMTSADESMPGGRAECLGCAHAALSRTEASYNRAGSRAVQQPSSRRRCCARWSCSAATCGSRWEAHARRTACT